MAKASRTSPPPTLTWARLASVPTHDRTVLSRSEIVAAAIRLLDEQGPDAFSMRRLGQVLDAGATSLYWHVRNKDELIDLMLDEVIGEVLADYEAHVPAEADWRERLSEVARALRRVLIRHRHIAPLLGERPTLGPQALDAAERVMGILHDAGFDDRRTSLASGALINYATGFALFESRSPGGGDSPERHALAEAVMAYFAQLPPDRYPTMRAVAAVPITEEDQFEYGLQRLLDGIAIDRGERGPAPDDRGDGNAMLLR